MEDARRVAVQTGIHRVVMRFIWMKDQMEARKYERTLNISGYIKESISSKITPEFSR